MPMRSLTNEAGFDATVAADRGRASPRAARRGARARRSPGVGLAARAGAARDSAVVPRSDGHRRADRRRRGRSPAREEERPPHRGRRHPGARHGDRGRRDRQDARRCSRAAPRRELRPRCSRRRSRRPSPRRRRWRLSLPRRPPLPSSLSQPPRPRRRRSPLPPPLTQSTLPAACACERRRRCGSRACRAGGEASGRRPPRSPEGPAGRGPSGRRRRRVRELLSRREKKLAR